MRVRKRRGGKEGREERRGREEGGREGGKEGRREERKKKGLSLKLLPVFSSARGGSPSAGLLAPSTRGRAASPVAGRREGSGGRTPPQPADRPREEQS